MIHFCQQCGEPLPRPTGRGRPPSYCSTECRREAKRGYHNDPLWKRRSDAEDLPDCCQDHQTSGKRGRGGKCPQHRQQAEVQARWRQRDADLRRDRDTEEESRLWDALSAGHGMVMRDVTAGVNNRTGPKEGASTEFLDLAGKLDVLAKAAADHPWWSLSWELEGKPKMRFDVFEEVFVA